MRVEEPPKPLRFLQKIEKPVPRPPTPAVEVPSEVSEVQIYLLSVNLISRQIDSGCAAGTDTDPISLSWQLRLGSES